MKYLPRPVCSIAGYVCLTVSLAAQVAPIGSSTSSLAPTKDKTVQLEDFVVTGVFNATEAKKSHDLRSPRSTPRPWPNRFFSALTICC